MELRRRLTRRCCRGTHGISEAFRALRARSAFCFERSQQNAISLGGSLKSEVRVNKTMKPSIPMRRSSVLVLLLASLSACAVFGGGTQQPAVYSIPNMEQAKIRSDLTYKTVAGGDLKMDAYYPANFQNSTRLPAVILVHGDGSPSQLKNAKDWGCSSRMGE